MAFSSPGGEEPARAWQPRPEGAPSAPAPPPDPALLERVLRRTSQLYACGGGEELDAEEVEAFVEVGRRHRGRPLELEPVAVDLVQAALGPHFPAETESAEARRGLFTRIAQTLLDDVVARGRLETFWRQLSEGRV